MDAHCERIRFMLDTGLERQKAVQTNLDSFFEPGTRKRKAGFHKTTMAQTRTLLDEQERTIKYLRTEMARVERAFASVAGIGENGDCSFETRSVLNKWVKPKDAEEALLLFFGYTKFEIKDQGGRDLAVLSPPDANAPVLYGEIDLDKLPSGHRLPVVPPRACPRRCVTQGRTHEDPERARGRRSRMWKRSRLTRWRTTSWTTRWPTTGWTTHGRRLVKNIATGGARTRDIGLSPRKRTHKTHALTI